MDIAVFLANCFFDGKDTYIIDHPAIKLVRDVKRICSFAKFDYKDEEGWKWYLIIGLVVGILFPFLIRIQ